MFLSTEFSDCKLALKSGVAAARIIPTGVAKTRDSQLKVAFDGDAVIFSEESQEIYDSQGLDAFDKNEKIWQTNLFQVALLNLSFQNCIGSKICFLNLTVPSESL